MHKGSSLDLITRSHLIAVVEMLNVFTFEDVQHSPLVQVAIQIATTATTCTSGTNRDRE